MKQRILSIIVSCILLSVAVMSILPPSAGETPIGWTEDGKLTDVDGYSSSNAKIAVDSTDNLHIVWNDYRNGPGEIYYMKLDEAGNILVGEKPVSDLDAASSTMGDMVVDSNDNVHIIWSDVRDTGPIPNLELYYEKLDSSGNTLVDETRITFAPYYSHYPSLAVDSSDNLHIAYCEEIDVGTLQEEIHYIKLDNSGNILVDDTAVTNADAEESLFPDIAVDSLGNAHIVWLDDRNETGTTKCQDYYYSKLDGNGNTLVEDTMIFKNGDHFQPSIAVDSDDMIQMIISNRWFSSTNEKKHMYYMKLSNSGDHVIPAQRVSTSDENASDAVFSLDSEGNLNMVWEDERYGRPEIYYMKLDGMGNILFNESRLTQNMYNSTLPAITMNATDGKHVVWSDDRDYMSGRSEVYYKHSIEEYENQAPVVWIESPSEGMEVSGGVVIEGWAEDYDGNIQLVEVSIDGEEWEEAAGTDTWTYPWNSTLVANGPHTVSARCFDGLNYSAEDTRNITVDNIPPNEGPSVTITPFDGDVSGTVIIKGRASDTDGYVMKVEVDIDFRGWEEATGSTSWSMSWDTTSEEDGDYFIRARAVDDDGEYSSIDTITASVINWLNTAPHVAITSPTGGVVSGTVVVTGTATDIDGDSSITSVQVMIDGVWEDAEGTADWTYTWDTLALDDGSYVISVRAFDGTEYSDETSVTVYLNNPHAPALTITSDIPYKASGTLIIRGTATDYDGEIATVEIQVDEGDWRVFSESGQWSYELDTEQLSNGRHTVRIRVTDDEGESDIETVLIDVENAESFPYWVLIIGFAILAIMLIIIGLKMRKKPEITAQYQ